MKEVGENRTRILFAFVGVFLCFVIGLLHFHARVKYVLPYGAGTHNLVQSSIPVSWREDNGNVQGGSGMKSKKNADGLLYVVQKHAATHVHYDLRLEIDGVLVSWALPKKPTNDPHFKRLAVFTTAHPMSYATFEGVIPEDSYGAGTVMVWDTGTYGNIKEHNGKKVSLATCLENGLLEIFIYGQKLHGAFTLVRMQSDPTKWLFIKMHDTYEGKQIAHEARSAITDRTMEQITKDARKK